MPRARFVTMLAFCVTLLAAPLAVSRQARAADAPPPVDLTPLKKALQKAQSAERKAVSDQSTANDLAGQLEAAAQPDDPAAVPSRFEVITRLLQTHDVAALQKS